MPLLLAALAFGWEHLKFLQQFLPTPGYEGPSVSIHHDWAEVARATNALAQDCGVDLSQDVLAFDDLTYDALKTHRARYYLHYLAVQGEVTKLGTEHVISLLKPKAALARCSEFVEAGLSYSHQRGELCCRVF